MYKMIQFDEYFNKLTVVWNHGLNQVGVKRTIVEEYWFDNKYKGVKLSKIEKYEYNDEGIYDSYSIKTLKK